MTNVNRSLWEEAKSGSFMCYQLNVGTYVLKFVFRTRNFATFANFDDVPIMF